MATPIRILLVEDLPEDAELAERELRSAGIDHVLLRVLTREALLDALATFSPDIVLSDYSLPGFDGMEALRITRECSPELPFVVLTGTLNEETAVALMKAGADDYVLKDRVGRLGPAISAAIERSSMRRERERAERALRESERRLRASELRFRELVELLPQTVFEFDMGWNLSFANREGLKQFGFFPEDLSQGINVEALVRPGDLEQLKAAFDRLIRGAAPRGFEFEAVRSDGTTFPAMAYSRAIFREGVPAGVRGIVFDLSELRASEERARQTEELFRLISESATDYISVLDLDGHYQYASPSFAAVVGEQNTLIGRDSAGDVHPADRERFRAHLRTLIATGKSQRVECRIRAMDGTYRTAEVEGSIMRDAGGSPSRLLIVARDVTERKRWEEEILRHRERLSNAQRLGMMGDWELDLANGSSFWSDEMFRLFRRDISMGVPDEHELLQYYGEEGMRRVREEIARVVATGEASSLELAIRFDDGGIAHHYSTINAGKDDRGGVARILGTTLDITARKETERSVSSLMNAVEHTDEVVFMTELDGAITYVNPAFERVYGYTKAESLGRTPRLIKSGTMAPEYFRQLWNDLLAGKSSRARHVNRNKKGNLVIADTSINPIMGSSGEITGFICVQNDITEREHIEREKHDLEIQLFQSQKMESLGTLAGGIAHDFNNILGIIMGYASMLEGTRPDPAVLQKHLDAVLGATQRGANLVRQILTFARKTSVEFQPVDISGVIREVVVMLSETFPRTIAFLTQMEDGPLVVKADRTLIHQALLNLCVNARDAMPNGGQLTISTTTVDGQSVRSRFRSADAERYLLLRIRDTGLGMSRATVGRIFEPFFTTKEPGKGTGLGLSVVYGIVNSHNGFVDVDSAPGTGTAVSLYLPFPRAEAPKDPALRRDNGESRGGWETILVVEDEPMLQELLRGQLEARGYAVLTANDGEEAVRVFAGRANDIDLVLTDLGLPRMNGWDAFKEMQKINPGIRCVVATGYLEPAAKNEMLASGAKEFVHKPYLPQDVIGKVRQVLDEEGAATRR